MKGLLYGNFVLNKVWFIASAVLAAVGVAVTAVVHNIDTMSGAGMFVLMASELVVVSVCNEWLARNLESNLKSRFADYALAGGISKGQFVMSEMLKNLISAGISFVMCFLMQLVLCVFDRGFFSLDNIKTLFVLVLLMGAVEWACVPVVVSLKSAEKAGIVVGLVLGFGVFLPLLIMFRAFGTETDEEFFPRLLEFIEKPWFVFVFAAMCAAVYALFYFIMLNRVKKGDVC